MRQQYITAYVTSSVVRRVRVPASAVTTQEERGVRSRIFSQEAEPGREFETCRLREPLACELETEGVLLRGKYGSDAASSRAHPALRAHPPAPVIVALVLVPFMENTLRQTLFMAHGDWRLLVLRPLSLALLLVGVLVLAAPPVVAALRRTRRAA